MSRWKWVLLFLVIALIGTYIYFEFRVPTGIEPMGSSEENVARIGLYSAIVGSIASLLSLIKEVVGIFKAKNDDT